MKKNLQLIKRQTKSLFLWGLLVLLSFSLTDAFGQATLPTVHHGPWQAMNKTGWTQTGLGIDYSSELTSSSGGSANFDGAGDNIVISFTGSPGDLTYYANYSGISAAFNGRFVVEESVDGVAYSVLRTITSELKRNASGTLYTDNPSSTSRYIRFRFVTKSSTQNFQLDNVLIAANNGPEINVKQGTIDYLTGSNYAFATQNVKTTSGAITFTIQNTGTLDLNLSGSPLIAISGTNKDEFIINQITTASPVGANGGSTNFTVSFAPVSFGNKTATITILNNDSNEGTYTINLTGSADILPPTVSGISPASGQIGSTVIISGTNLINTTDVLFNNTTASIKIDNDGQITATVPAGATSGPITVANGKGSVSGPIFTVIFQPVPTITAFNPPSGTIGQTVVITGTDFTGATSVKFNSVPAAYKENSSTQITATVPASATTGPITITTPGGTVTSTNNFTVLLLPEIMSISPDFGSPGDIITITGINFTDATDVSFNGVTAAYDVISDGEIIAEVPVGATSGFISVTTNGGTASSETFTIVVSAPFISEISPAAAMAGEIITITGVNFSGTTEVTFNGVTAAYEANSDGEIIAEVPAGLIAGTVTIAVNTSGGSITSEAFTLVVPEPTITSISPASGKVGALVTITGTNFTNATNVSFNGISAAYTVDNDGQITVQVPSGATSGQVSVTTAGGAASSEIFNVIIPNTTYTWNVGAGNWMDANSWTPVRNTLTNADILIFDGSKTTNPTVNLDFATSQTIGQIKFINSVIANLNVSADKTLILDNGVSGADLDIAANSSVTIDNVLPEAELTLRITAGETGIVAGTLAIRGGAGTAEHRIITEDVDGLIFQNGSTFRTGVNFAGNPFGTTNLNTIRFASGSTYRNAAGGSPFGAVAPNSVLIFDPGSLYRHESNAAPDLNNRTYSNFEVNNATFDQTVTGTGNLNLNNLTITSANNFNVNLSGNININGNINAAAGTLNFNPAAVNNINMSGTGTKIIYGTGVLALGSNAQLNVPLGITVDLRKQISGTGQVVVDGAIKTNVEDGFAGGAATALNSGVTPVLNAGSVIEYNALGAQTVSPIDYRNLIISGNRSGNTITLAPGTIRVAEALTNPATIVVFNTTDNTVEFNGGAQTIPVLPYNNLTAAGTASKSIVGNLQVNGIVHVSNQQGATINTGANKIILNNTASLFESQTSYIMGTVEATRNVMAGNTQSFGQIGITLAPAAGSLNPGSTKIIRSTGISPVQLNEEKQSIARTYNITATNSSGLNTAITLKYSPSELLSGQEEAKLSMYKKAGADPWAEQVGSYIRSSVQRTVTLTGVTGFSTWTLGEGATLLPVELVQFTATRRGQNVQLNWATAMELDNKGFEVQVSTDAENFKVVSFVESKNSNAKELQQYNFVDNKTKPADVLYYRLKQVDFDGTETYSAIKAVTYNKEQFAITATAYPNPFDDSFTVVVNADAHKVASLTITDAMGKKVMEKTVTLTKGSNDVEFNLGSQYPAGIYIINLTTNNFQQNLKMVKK